MEFVKIKNVRIDETLYFYDHNWEAFRKIALDRGYLKSYKLYFSGPDPNADFDIILVTEYSSKADYESSEAGFQEIISEIRPDGSKLLNATKPGEFRETVFVEEVESISRGVK